MDKLEFDTRLAQLERRVSLLTALFLGLLALVGAGLLFTLVSLRASPHLAESTPPQAVMTATVEAPGDMHAVGGTHAVHPPAPPDISEGGVGHLVVRLEELADVNRRGLITEEELQSKKDELLAKPLHSTNLTQELEQVSELQRKSVISDGEYQLLKTKILAAVQ